MPDHASHLVSMEQTEAGASLSLRGDWIISDVDHVERTVQKLVADLSELAIIDATHIERMDTAGAFLFRNIHQKLLTQFPALKITGLNTNCTSLVDLISAEIQKIQSATTQTIKQSVAYSIGKKTIETMGHLSLFFAFFGEVFLSGLEHVVKPLQIQWKSTINEIDLCGFQALPIIAVMMFLIGLVLAYQLGVQLETYGANAYIVELSGVAILREFSPLICSVIIAGRTSTSFAALIGTMKVNEEIDVLRTMGLSPIERLVLPKIIGMMIALPLLVVWGNIFGVLGSMCTTWYAVCKIG